MSKPEALSRRKIFSVASATGLVYVIISCLWIAFSDKLLLWFSPTSDIETLSFLQTIKGWGFVFVTGLLFTIVLARKLAEIGRTQQSLQDHMESYRMLFEHNPQPMWIYDPDTLRFVEVNEAAIRAYGYSREEFLAMTVANIRAADSSGEPAPVSPTDSNLPIEGVWKHLWKDGSRRDVHITTGPTSFLGRQLRLTLATDITEQYKAEEELRRSECKFRSVLDNSVDVIYELNPETGSYNYVSPSAQRVLHLAADNLLHDGSQLLSTYIHHDDLARVKAHFRELSLHSGNGQMPPSVEYRVQTADNERWVRETSSIVRNGSDAHPAVVGTIRDVTEQKRHEDAVRELNEELERRVHRRTVQLQATNSELEAFSYSVSHDLRAPLRSIGGFSRILIEDYSSQLDERGKDYLQRVQAAGMRMSNLIDALLNLSHVTRSIIKPVPVNLSTIAISIVDELRAAHPQREVQFQAAPDMTIQADFNMMRIVLENLLGNAWKFTSRRKDAVIELFSQTEDGQIVYTIRDNGVGFDMEYASKLFTPFQRLHSARDFEGTGIGLATVQRIINRHGGRVWVDSAVDRGATFSFTLSV